MTIVVIAFIVLGLIEVGVALGYQQSENKFGKMVDDGLIVFKIEEGEGKGGWDGTPKALADIKKWINR
jgi:hypothetical protein